MRVRLQLLGALVAIDTSDEELSHLLRLLWKPFETTSRRQPNETFVARRSNDSWMLTWNGGENRVRHLDVWSLVDSLRYQMLDVAAHHRGDNYVWVHAGAVQLGGLVVLLPGEAGSGKTTLVLALLSAGWTYLSDDLAALDLGTHEIVPFPKPLGIKDPHLWEANRHLFAGIREPAAPRGAFLIPPVGLAITGVPGRPTCVIFPRFEAGPSLESERLTQGEAAALLSRYVDPLDERAVKSISRLVARCACFRMSYERERDAVAWIWQVCGSS